VNETPVILVLGPDEGPRKALAESGFDVTVSESRRPAAVLLDLDEVDQPYPRIAEVRAQFPDAAVIARSRHVEPRHVVEAVRSGAQDFVGSNASRSFSSISRATEPLMRLPLCKCPCLGIRL